MRGQCPLLYGEVTEDTKEAITIMEGQVVS